MDITEAEVYFEKRWTEWTRDEWDEFLFGKKLRDEWKTKERGRKMGDEQMDWDKAKHYFHEVLEQYKGRDEPDANIAYILDHTFNPLLARFNDGERTRELYDAMLAVA